MGANFPRLYNLSSNSLMKGHLVKWFLFVDLKKFRGICVQNGVIIDQTVLSEGDDKVS
jgi:hypothetical protein